MVHKYHLTVSPVSICTFVCVMSVNKIFARRHCLISTKLGAFDTWSCGVECEILPYPVALVRFDKIAILGSLTNLVSLAFAYESTDEKSMWTGPFVHPVMMNTLTRQFSLLDQKCRMAPPVCC